MIKDLGWHSLQERRAMSRLTLMYKLQDSAWPSRWGSIWSRQARSQPVFSGKHEGPFCPTCTFIFRNERNRMKKSARVSEKLVSPGLPGLQVAMRLVGNSGRATTRSTSQHRFRNITANKNCYRVFLFSVDCPWVKQPARPSRSAHSVETFRA